MKEGTTWTDQELDALFQDAAARENIPPFQEAFWDEMEAMLPAKKKRIGFIWWGAASFLMVSLGIAGAILLTNANPDGETTRVAKQIGHETNNSGDQHVDNNEIAKSDVSVDVTRHYFPETGGKNNNQSSPYQEETQYRTDGGSASCGGGAPKNSVEKVEEADLADLGYKQPLFTAPKTLNAVRGSKYSSGLPLYAEIGLGFGQSYRQAEYSSNWMPQIRAGLGLYREIGGMELNAGFAFRAELPDNITYEMINSTSSTDIRTTVDINRLYSLEFPLYMGGKFGRSSIGGMMIPGIQMRFSGVRTVYQNSQITSRDEISGRTFESKTMTMEMGLRYTYSLNENVQLTSSFTLDVVRPFQSDEYLGDVKQYPATFFVGLRRTF